MLHMLGALEFEKSLLGCQSTVLSWLVQGARPTDGRALANMHFYCDQQAVQTDRLGPDSALSQDPNLPVSCSMVISGYPLTITWNMMALQPNSRKTDVCADVIPTPRQMLKTKIKQAQQLIVRAYPFYDRSNTSATSHSGQLVGGECIQMLKHRVGNDCVGKISTIMVHKSYLAQAKSPTQKKIKTLEPVEMNKEW